MWNSDAHRTAIERAPGSATDLVVRPNRYRQFGAQDGVAFCLVTNRNLMDRFRIDDLGSYTREIRIGFDTGDSFEQLLDSAIPEPAHVLIVSPDCFFQSPAPAGVGRRKLMMMACNSTPTSLETIRYFLDVIERTDPAQQEAFADRFFTLGEASDQLEFVDERYDVYAKGAHATFEHLSEHY